MLNYVSDKKELPIVSVALRMYIHVCIIVYSALCMRNMFIYVCVT